MYVKQGKEGRWSHLLSDAYAPENLTSNLKMDPLEEEIPFLEVIIFRFDVKFRRFCLGFSSAQAPGAKQLPGIKPAGIRTVEGLPKKQEPKKNDGQYALICVFFGWLIFSFRILGFMKAQGRKTWVSISSSTRWYVKILMNFNCQTPHVFLIVFLVIPCIIVVGRRSFPMGMVTFRGRLLNFGRVSFVHGVRDESRPFWEWLVTELPGLPIDVCFSPVAWIWWLVPTVYC